MLSQEGRVSVIYLISFLVIGFVALSLAGCGGGGGGGGGTADLGSGSLQLAFGNVVLDHFEDKTITLRNKGSANGSIGQIAPVVAPFTIETDTCSNAILIPGATCSVMVRFQPVVQATYSDTFDIPSSSGTTTVSVSGDGLAFKVSINQVNTSSCPTIKIVVSVTDRGDAPVTLLEQNFTLHENGLPIDEYPLDTTLNFSSFSPPLLANPLSVALALDYSSSVTDVLNSPPLALETAAKSFIDQLDLSQDAAEIIKFADGVVVMQPFTSNQGLLNTAIETLPGIPDGTRLYDAVSRAIDDTSVRNDRRAVVVFSDGRDRDSISYTLSGVVDRALLKGVPVFTIGFGYEFQAVLEHMANETGGQYFQAPPSGDLQGVFDVISDLLSNQYEIEYTTLTNCASGTTITLDMAVDLLGEQGEGSISVVIP